jgi:hypothetical protein
VQQPEVAVVGDVAVVTAVTVDEVYVPVWLSRAEYASPRPGYARTGPGDAWLDMLVRC